MDTNWSDMVRALEGWGWSLTAIADSIGLSIQALGDIKQGRTKAPTGMAAVNLHSLYRRELRRSRKAA